MTETIANHDTRILPPDPAEVPVRGYSLGINLWVDVDMSDPEVDQAAFDADWADLRIAIIYAINRGTQAHVTECELVESDPA